MEGGLGADGGGGLSFVFLEEFAEGGLVGETQTECNFLYAKSGGFKQDASFLYDIVGDHLFRRFVHILVGQLGEVAC